MSRPLKIALSAAGAIALAVVVVAFALRRKDPVHPALEAQDPVVATAPLAPVGSEPPPPPPVPAARPPGPVVPPPHRAPTEAAKVAPPLDEAPLMEKLRALGATNPALTIALARDGNNRFPDSPDAPERAWMVAKSLADMANFKEAREEAEIMVKQYPGTSWALDVQRHLLSNPLDSGGGGP